MLRRLINCRIIIIIIIIKPNELQFGAAQSEGAAQNLIFCYLLQLYFTLYFCQWPVTVRVLSRRCAAI